MSSKSSFDLRSVASNFQVLGTFLEAGPHGSGHINDTFAAVFGQAGTHVRYILQRINHRIFKEPAKLMENISRVSEQSHARLRRAGIPDTSRRALTVLPALDGRPYHQDEAQNFWRCYLFIENARTYDVIESPKQAYETARAFGEFQNLMSDMPGPRLHETIPQFHHTRSRFERLQVVAKADPHNRLKDVAQEYDFICAREAVVDVLQKLLESGEMPERVTHNDTKLNNVMIDDATQTGLCAIDLDTVMPGLALHDFGDMVRTATSPALEDEPDVSKVRMQMPMFEALVEGYISAAGSFLNATEKEYLAFSGKLITLEIGIRFLTDFLEGDVYFKIAEPNHNLRRARTQIALVSSIEKQEPEMQRLVKQRLTATRHTISQN